jgi:hypothetical protein
MGPIYETAVRKNSGKITAVLLNTVLITTALLKVGQAPSCGAQLRRISRLPRRGETLRRALGATRTGGKTAGATKLTQQVAHLFFLSAQVCFARIHHIGDAWDTLDHLNPSALHCFHFLRIVRHQPHGAQLEVLQDRAW